MSRGFYDTGRFLPVFAVESDFDAAETYEMNFGSHVARDTDRRPLLIEEVANCPEVDVVIGGPPCQGFSPLNRTKVGLERRALWRQYLRLLEESGARFFVMENVPQLIGSAELRRFAKQAWELGYEVEWDVLNAADFGVPQKRKRAIVIGGRGVSPVWPEPTHDDPARGTPGRLPWETFRRAVVGLPLTPNGVNWHVGRTPRPESITRYEAVPPDGGNRFQMQENLDRAGLSNLVLPCFRNKPTGTTDVFGRLWWDKPAVTIRTEFYKPEKGRYLHPTQHRAITVREAARCMSFDDEFILPPIHSMTSVAKQIGNAVPPVLAQRIAEALARALDEAAHERRVA